MIPDIDGLSLNELQRLRVKVDNRIKQLGDTTRRDLLKKMQKLAQEHGMSLEQLLEKEPKPAPAAKAPAKPAGSRKGKSASPRKGSTVAPKYRHPEDASLTWTGRGRQPVWVRNWVEAGSPLDALLIPPSA